MKLPARGPIVSGGHVRAFATLPLKVPLAVGGHTPLISSAGTGCTQELRVKDWPSSLGSAPHLLWGFGKPLNLLSLFSHPSSGEN